MKSHQREHVQAFSVATYDLGAYPEYFGQGDIHLGVKESTRYTKVLGRMYDGIEFRGFHQKDVESLAENANVPVWNGLTNEWHPTQMILDFFTLKENLGTLSGKTLTYVGDARNNVAHDLLVTGAILGVNVHIAAPVSSDLMNPYKKWLRHMQSNLEVIY